MVDGTEKMVSLSETEARALQHAVRAQLDVLARMGLAASVNGRSTRLESILQKLCKSSA